MHAQSPAARPVIWIFSTGTEILQGASVDRNSPWISARLQELGLATDRHIAIPDDAAQLRIALDEAAQRADLVITTGGLGPTADDLNRAVIAEIWDTELQEDPHALAMIEERFRKRGRSLTPQNRVQALIPHGAVTLYNDNGTAPGFYIRPDENGPRARMLALPGPPREMAPMFEALAAPLISADFAAERRQVCTALLHTCCIPESELNQHLADLFGSEPQVNVALLAKLSHVDVRLTFTSREAAENERLCAQWRDLVRTRLGAENIYGEDETRLEQVVGNLLLERKQTIATSESCTGGQLAGRITEASGTTRRRQRARCAGDGARRTRRGRHGLGCQRHRNCRPQRRHGSQACRHGLVWPGRSG